MLQKLRRRAWWAALTIAALLCAAVLRLVGWRQGSAGTASASPELVSPREVPTEDSHLDSARSESPPVPSLTDRTPETSSAAPELAAHPVRDELAPGFLGWGGFGDLARLERDPHFNPANIELGEEGHRRLEELLLPHAQECDRLTDARHERLKEWVSVRIEIGQCVVGQQTLRPAQGELLMTISKAGEPDKTVVVKKGEYAPLDDADAALVAAVQEAKTAIKSFFINYTPGEPK